MKQTPLQTSARRFVALFLMILLTLPALPARAAEAGNGGKKLIAITFDDGPSDHTPTLLDGLEARGAVATFFMCGRNGSHGVVKHSDVLTRMVSLGCQLANHSNEHPNFTKLSADQIHQQLEVVEPYLYNAVGDKYLEVVRIPGGSNTERIRANTEHPIIIWSIDPLDWRDRNEEVVYKRILEKSHDGGVILLHDLYPTSIAAGLRAIDTLRERGYEFVTVSELFRRRGVYLQNGVTYTGAPSAAEAVTKPAYTAPLVDVRVNPSTGETTVSMDTTENGVESIHYTTDGSLPTLASPKYTGSFTVSKVTNIRAAGFDRFATRTPLNEKEVQPGVARPRIADTAHGRLTLTCPTEGAQILYTTNGSDPRTDGQEYTAPFTAGELTRAVAVAQGKARSDVLNIVKMSNGAFYCDVPYGAWYASGVDDVISQGLMNGVEPYYFAPESPTTRAALVTILYRMENSPHINKKVPWTDVQSGEWYSDAVAWAYDKGLITGKSDTLFGPSDTLTRQQAATIVKRYADWAKLKGKTGGTVNGFRDAAGVAAYAVEPMAWCVENEMLRSVGDNRIAPEEAALRAQVAVMISKLHALKK
ncbi:MAG: chitobiase/beta-hexosaminidase C-terminal domain-containing protein [Oscillospiraceae bacterium]|nr:chitobiase/beta-hexosaminidase C-terminal domain-containing protein [Oscillospiraceae bacterium]